MHELGRRKILPHVPPPWVTNGALFFVTICTKPRRKNQLCLPQTGTNILKSAAYYQQIERWWIRLILLMPDHVHVVMAGPRGNSLPYLIKMWKIYQAKTLAICWQDGFFDHRLRSDESEEEKLFYIRMNPVRAELVAAPEEWPYFWPRDQRGSSGGRALPQKLPPAVVSTTSTETNVDR